MDSDFPVPDIFHQLLWEDGVLIKFTAPDLL